MPRRRGAAGLAALAVTLVVALAGSGLLAVAGRIDALGTRAMEDNYAEQQRLVAVQAGARLKDLAADLELGLSSLRAHPEIDWSDPESATSAATELWLGHCSREIRPPTVRVATDHEYPVTRGRPHSHHLEAEAGPAAIGCSICLGEAGVLPVVAPLRPGDPDTPLVEFELDRHLVSSRLDPMGRRDSVWWADRRTGTLLASPESRFDGADLREAAGPCLPGFAPILDPGSGLSGTASYCWPYDGDRLGRRIAGWASVTLLGMETVIGASTDREVATAPLARAGRLHGLLTGAIVGMGLLVLGVAGWFARARLRQGRRAARESLSALSAALEERDRYTRFHSENVGIYAAELGRRLGYGAQDQSDLRFAGQMHDIGKIGICDGILGKPGGLTAAERDVMKEHTLIGERILSPMPWAAPFAEVAGCHHERIDGEGYPRGLAGDAIPTMARIVAVADVFDALLTDRPYRQAMTLAAALRVIAEGEGTHFDPEVVEALMKDPAGLRSMGRGRAPGDRADAA